MRVAFIPYVQGRNDYTDSDGQKFGIAIHNTSNDASDSGEAAYAARRTDGIGSHFYGDLDSVTQSIDTADRVGHAGSREGNENAVCVEITGGNGKSRAWWLANVAWDLLGRVLATVIRHHWPDGSFQVRRASVAEMKANPRVKAFYGHDDMRLAWGGTTHTDPGPNFPWDRLFQAVNTALKGDVVADSPHLTTTHWRVYGACQMDEEINNHVNDEHEKMPLVTTLKRIDQNGIASAAALPDIAADVAEIKEALAGDTINYDLLADKVADRLAAKLSLGFVPVTAPDNPGATP